MTTQHATEYFGEMQDGESGMTTRSVSYFEILFALIFTGLLGGLVYFIVSPATLPVRQVRIEGEFRYLSPEVLQELVRDRVRGGFFNVNVNALRDAILTEPWVREVSVHRIWPDGLQVFVDEQTAIARWKDTGLLNREGEYFTPDKTTYPTDIPLLEGPTGTQYVMVERYLHLQEMLQPFDLDVARLILDERRSWQFQLDNGLSVVLGKKDFDEKTSKFIRFVLVDVGQELGEMKLVDMRYTNGFAVQWRNDYAGRLSEGGVERRW